MAEPESQWNKVDIFVRNVGPLLTPIIVAILGIVGSVYLNEQQDIREAQQNEDRASRERLQSVELAARAKQQRLDVNSRLYTELMSTREQTDSALRRGMFETIIKMFLDDANSEETEEKTVLALEMLAHNFHDVIDLEALFRHVREQIPNTETEENNNLRERLKDVAKEVVIKQVITLAGHSPYTEIRIDFEESLSGAKDLRLPLRTSATQPRDSSLPIRRFSVQVLRTNRSRHELTVLLRVMDEKGNREVYSSFDVGYFNFPMIDNIRLPGGARCAVVLLDFWEEEGTAGAKLGLVYFPASRASLKERQYYDEVFDELMRNQTFQEGENDQELSVQ